MKKIDLKKKAGVVACAAVMSMTMAVPCAFAAVTGNNGTTDVTVQTDPASTQCSWEAPTVIPFAADAAGNLTGPSADAVKIVNKSVFPIHVVNMAVAEQSPFKLVADVTVGTAANAFQFTVNGLQAAESVDTSAISAWNMGYATSANDTISLDITDAKIARVTADISAPQKAATITWTVASGAAQ